MCWIGKMTTKRKTARENIKIYKVVCKSKFKNIYRAIYYDYYYELNEINNTYFLLSTTEHYMYIYSGFHSFSSSSTIIYTTKNNSAIKIVNCKNPSDMIMCFTKQYDGAIVLVEGYIPKGSFYYENERGEIVSEQIVLTHEKEISRIFTEDYW